MGKAMKNRKQIGIRLAPEQLVEIKRAAAQRGMPVSKYVVLAVLDRAARDDATTTIAGSLAALERKLDVRLDEALAQQAAQLDDAKQELVEGVSAALAESRQKLGEGWNKFLGLAAKKRPASTGEQR